MKKVYIYGAGGHGKVVLDAMHSNGQPCDGFIDVRPIGKWANLSVVNDAEISNKESHVHIAIGNSNAREKIANSHQHFNYFSIHHLKSIISPTASISSLGVFLAANCIIGPDASIADHTIVNHGAVVDHDCVIGAYCHIAPNATLGGNVSIGNHVMVGAGAVILPGVKIANHVTIGAGAVVTRDIDIDGIKLIGVPAKLMN